MPYPVRKAVSGLHFVFFIFAAAGICTSAVSQAKLSEDQKGARASPVLDVISLAEPTRTAKLESEADVSDVKFANGFFLESETNGHVRVRDRKGRITADLTLRPNIPGGQSAAFIVGMNDAAVFRDGSFAASFTYMLRADKRRYYFLIHFTKTGDFIEEIDLGISYAARICIAGDESVWTLSSQSEFGHEVYSADEGVLRNYKFGSGLIGAFVARSHFPSYNEEYALGGSALDCVGDGVHALTGDHQWIEFSPDKGVKFAKIVDFEELFNLVQLPGGHTFGMVMARSGEGSKRMFAELVPSGDGTALHWQEVGFNLPSGIACVPAKSPELTPTSTAVTGLLGEDDEDGEQIVYRTSLSDQIFWSTPRYGDSAATPDCRFTSIGSLPNAEPLRLSR